MVKLFEVFFTSFKSQMVVCLRSWTLGRYLKDEGTPTTCATTYLHILSMLASQ